MMSSKGWTRPLSFALALAVIASMGLFAAAEGPLGPDGDHDSSTSPGEQEGGTPAGPASGGGPGEPQESEVPEAEPEPGESPPAPGRENETATTGEEGAAGTPEATQTNPGPDGAGPAHVGAGAPPYTPVSYPPLPGTLPAGSYTLYSNRITDGSTSYAIDASSMIVFVGGDTELTLADGAVVEVARILVAKDAGNTGTERSRMSLALKGSGTLSATLPDGHTYVGAVEARCLTVESGVTLEATNYDANGYGLFLRLEHGTGPHWFTVEPGASIVAHGGNTGIKVTDPSGIWQPEELVVARIASGATVNASAAKGNAFYVEGYLYVAGSVNASVESLALIPSYGIRANAALVVEDGGHIRVEGVMTDAIYVGRDLITAATRYPGLDRDGVPLSSSGAEGHYRIIVQDGGRLEVDTQGTGPHIISGIGLIEAGGTLISETTEAALSYSNYDGSRGGFVVEGTLEAHSSQNAAITTQNYYNAPAPVGPSHGPGLHVTGSATVVSESKDGIKASVGLIVVEDGGMLTVRAKHNGINSEGDVLVDGGTLIAQTDSNGIYTEGDVTSRSGGLIKASASTDESRSVYSGIRALGNVYADDGTIEASGFYYGVFCDNEIVADNGGVIDSTTTRRSGIYGSSIAGPMGSVVEAYRGGHLIERYLAPTETVNTLSGKPYVQSTAQGTDMADVRNYTWGWVAGDYGSDIPRPIPMGTEGLEPDVTAMGVTLVATRTGDAAGEPVVLDPSGIHTIIMPADIMAEQFTVSFYMDDGAATPFRQELVDRGTSVNKPTDPTREGHSFSHWADRNGNKWNFSTPVTADLDLYAQWTKNGGGTTPPEQFTVSFYMDDGAATPFRQELVDRGTSVNKPTDPTREGYTFSHWADRNGNKWNFSTPVTADLDLYAQWTKNGGGTTPPEQFTVSFYMDDGAATPFRQELVDRGTSVNKPTDPTREGHSFSHWADRNGNKWNFSTPVTADLDLYAQWTKDGGTPPVDPGPGPDPDPKPNPDPNPGPNPPPTDPNPGPEPDPDPSPDPGPSPNPNPKPNPPPTDGGDNPNASENWTPDGDTPLVPHDLNLFMDDGIPLEELPDTGLGGVGSALPFLTASTGLTYFIRKKRKKA